MSWNFLGDDPDAIVERARRLAADIERITRGEALASSDLAAAAILDRWRLISRNVPSLIGIVSRHPHVRKGHGTLTTELFAIDAERGLARTWSRLYLLGRPGDADDRSLQ
jgi:hypothetical protein